MGAIHLVINTASFFLISFSKVLRASSPSVHTAQTHTPRVAYLYSKIRFRLPPRSLNAATKGEKPSQPSQASPQNEEEEEEERRVKA